MPTRAKQIVEPFLGRDRARPNDDGGQIVLQLGLAGRGRGITQSDGGIAALIGDAKQPRLARLY